MEREFRLNIPEELLEHLQYSIKNVWEGHVVEESYDWNIKKGCVGFKVLEKDKGHGVVVEIAEF